MSVAERMATIAERERAWAASPILNMSVEELEEHSRQDISWLLKRCERLQAVADAAIAMSYEQMGAGKDLRKALDELAKWEKGDAK